MATICIVGAGELGGATAHALARGERVRRVLVIDEDGTIAAGKALDIQQSGAVEGFHTRVDGTNDLTRVAGAAVAVVADSGRPPRDRKSTRLNSSHSQISYAVFCLKKKKVGEMCV